MHEITITGLRKSFGRNAVLHGVDLRIEPGEFVGLMGPNGAGKSTLIKILAGIERADAGEIRYGGRTLRDLAQVREVGFLHQDLGLVEELSIADNLRLGEPPLRLAGPLLDRAREREVAAEALQRVGLTRSVRTPVAALAPGEKALVAVARLLDRGARVLVIDEATSTLPPADATRFVDALRMTTAAGATVIMVSHKLSEILDATKRVVVLLDGAIAADVSAEGLDRQGIVRLLVAHESQARLSDAERDPGEELVRLEAAYGGRAGPVELSLRAGEILGLTGVPGSGLHDVAHLVHGSLRPERGLVKRADGVRVALVPPHRESQGGFASMPVRSNLTVSSLARWRRPVRLLRLDAEREAAAGMVRRLSVRPADTEVPYGGLSGGNKQKVIFGRVLFEQPQVYVLCEPTRGVDIATRDDIYILIRELRDQDAAVLVVSSDSEDLFAVCDRIGVVRDGRVEALHGIADIKPEELEVFI